MKKLTTFILCLLISGLCATEPLLNEKNVITAEYRSIPEDYQNLLMRESGKWNFNFRPYDTESAEMLWSDSGLQRNVVLGEELDGKTPTAICVLFDDEGFSLLLFAGESGVKEAFEAGKSRPNSCFECFFQPGDADSPQFSHYYQFICQATKPRMIGVFPWLMEDKTFRSIENHISISSRLLSNGNMLKVTVPWEPLFDRLPFLANKRDHIWRLSVIRWAATGGQTFGGNVHQQTEAGYLRFPELTNEMKTKIMKNLLIKAWDFYKKTLSEDYLQPDILPINHNTAYVAERAKHPYDSFVIAEAYEFRNDVGNKMIADCDALGKQIFEFEKLPFDQQVAFYKNASAKLFNFRYDLQIAYGEWEKNQLFSEGVKR